MSHPHLADGYQESPLWWDAVAWPELGEAPPPSAADAVVVGAGYTGLAAALELARRGRSVVVLERDRLGSGASSRNGGMVHAGLRAGPDELERRYGPPGAALHQATVDAYHFIARLIADESIECHFEECGWLYLAHRSSRMRGLEDSARSHQDDIGADARMLTNSELGEETSAAGFAGGMVTSHGASLQPALYLAGLARAAIAAGAVVRGGVVCERVERSARGFTVHTGAGPVAAGEVLVATNGYTGREIPALQRRILPIGSYIIATEPLAAGQAEAVNRHRRMISDTRQFLHYWRLSPDRRMVFGGRASFARMTTAHARDLLYRSMIAMYPELEGIRLTHAWSGHVGFTFDQLPHLGRLDGVTYAMGYCGRGVAMATWLGTRAGAWLAGEEAPPYAGMRFPTAPGYRGNPWFLPVAGWWYQLTDRYM